MSMQKTLGGDRLGSGKKQKIELHNYERSTHDKGYLWRSTLSAGTLVPFLNEIALPGDTWDIDLNCDIKTHPTIGPLFGSFKVQLDVFTCPIRLYQGQLHNNKLGIGLKMANVKLPTIAIKAIPITNAQVNNGEDINNLQINPSSILAYLEIMGVGYTTQADTYREFCGLGLLAYWDIYKNYYANKQEEIGAVIHTEIQAAQTNVVEIKIGANTLPQNTTGTANLLVTEGTYITVEVTPATTQALEQILFQIANGTQYSLTSFTNFISKVGDIYTVQVHTTLPQQVNYWLYQAANSMPVQTINVTTFPLTEIDDMREAILAAAAATTPFDINAQNLLPYDFLFMGAGDIMSIAQSQEGLAVKAYQSDLFNNWLQTEWIDGPDGITAITAIDVSAGELTIDTLIMQRKVYDILNRIAVSGGAYQDWLDAVWVNPGPWRCESPMYMGGLIKELVFQEVVSNSEASTGETGTQPLGTLAGKGVMAHKHKGGHVTIKTDEPSYLIGIISLTPRLDYSQGNAWHVHLKTMDDLHKPGMDQIGFQDLITEQMAWWDTTNETGNIEDWIQKSAGKQPAWVNYMTNVNRCKGNFAIQNNEMFMTLNRRYTPTIDGGITKIEDLTTYIDPSKYNNIFAQTSLDSQNFWAQIAVDITFRGKISAKVMPNL